MESYRDLREAYAIYWRLYGGYRSILRSPYFHVAILITMLCSPAWLNHQNLSVWPNAATNILPNLMGFSIAGMAVFLAFSSPKTVRAITEDGEPKSLFTITIANFFHFILVQTIALLLGFIGLYFQSCVLTGIGVLTLVYALAISPAMAMQLLRTSQIINAAESLPDTSDGNGAGP